VGTEEIEKFISVEHANKISFIVMRKDTQLARALTTDKPTSCHFIEEDLLTDHFCLYLEKSSPLNKIINRKIDQLLQAGIIQKFEDERFEAIKRVDKSDHEEIARVLTLEHLGLCFIAIMIMLALSCVVFVIECVVGRIYV
jgi:hypothetical protein